MTDDFDDYEDPEQTEEESRRKRGEGKRGEGAGSVGRAKAPVSEAAMDLMRQMGFSKTRIAEVLRTWSNLVGDQLIRHMRDFAYGSARASAHLLVQFDLKGGFALVTNFLSNLSEHGLYTDPRSTMGRKRSGPR